jgi:hypothetical protein
VSRATKTFIKGVKVSERHGAGEWTAERLSSLILVAYLMHASARHPGARRRAAHVQGARARRAADAVGGRARGRVVGGVAVVGEAHGRRRCRGAPKPGAR